jgi:hypothetical protein
VEQYFEHDLYGDCLAILTMWRGLTRQMS